MTNNLKELTWENHKIAEKAQFMQRLIKRCVTKHEYYIYLYNQMASYKSLEYYASTQGFFDFENSHLYPLQRASNMMEDLQEMENTAGIDNPPIMNATWDYVNYIESIRYDKKKLLAHIYVRHMGDLSGGQIIKRLVPGPTRTYEFDANTEQLKSDLKSILSDSLADEANHCFTMVQDFLYELERYFAANMR